MTHFIIKVKLHKLALLKIKLYAHVTILYTLSWFSIPSNVQIELGQQLPHMEYNQILKTVEQSEIPHSYFCLNLEKLMKHIKYTKE